MGMSVDKRYGRTIMAIDPSMKNHGDDSEDRSPGEGGTGEDLSIVEAEHLLRAMSDSASINGIAPGRPISPPAREGVTDPAEARAERAEARYQTLVEQLPAVTFMASLQGDENELYVSPQIETMLGFSQEEWLSDPILWYRQLHPDDRGRWHAEFARTCALGQHFRSDYRFLARDGRIVWVRGEAQVTRDDRGNPLYIQGMAIDITTIKQAEDALRHSHAWAVEANQLKSDFLANVSHELRTPLNAIIGYADLLREMTIRQLPNDPLPDLEKIDRAGKHLLRVIDDILDISKLEAGKMRLMTEEFDVTELIREVGAAFRTLLTKNGNRLEMHIADNLGIVRNDPTRIRQCLYNLLGNACKFTRDGTISLDVWRRTVAGRDWLSIRVRDSGIGMSSEQVARLFQPFVQADSSTTRNFGGTGLGLAITKGLCEMMGGEIAVDSTPGRGATFDIRLPAVLDLARESTLNRTSSPPD